ncbi:hypothetical protein JW805_14110 [Roseomonas aeriglobus]|nr:hypothetical protein [Roseomonas aeriglobus]
MPRTPRKRCKTPQVRPVLTRDERAKAAASNVVCIDRRILTETVVNFILDKGSGTKSQPAVIRAAVEERRAAIRRPISPRISCPLPVGYDEIRLHLLALISPSRNEHALSWIISTWLGDPLKQHALKLDTLRGRHPRIYQALLAGQLPTAARLAVSAKLDQSRFTRLMCDHARILLIATAHDHIAHIRHLAMRPYGPHFAGNTTWKPAGNVLLTTIAEPALVVADLMKHARAAAGDDDKIRTSLEKHKLLASGAEGDFVWSVALDVRKILSRIEGSRERLDERLKSIAWDVLTASSMNNRTMSEEQLTERSMTSLWFGLEPREIAVFVAIELTRSLDSVETIVADIIAGRKLKRRAPWPSQTRAAFAASILRAEGTPDCEAAQLGKRRNEDVGLDPANKASRGAVARLQEKLQNPAIATMATRIFGIDAAMVLDR